MKHSLQQRPPTPIHLSHRTMAEVAETEHLQALARIGKLDRQPEMLKRLLALLAKAEANNPPAADGADHGAA